MTTIRESLLPVVIDAGYGRTEVQALRVVLDHLGIDPDLPAEWATVDRCLTWLRGEGCEPLGPPVWNGDGYDWEFVYIDAYPDARRYIDTYPDARRNFLGFTVHATLISACKAVRLAQEVQP